LVANYFCIAGDCLLVIIFLLWVVNW